jgi:uncharacterized membrane protein (UPF0127 family)
MKNIIAIIALFTSFAATPMPAADTSADRPGFYIGQTNFPRGDSIEITSVDRSAARLVVKGHYNLVSTGQADLDLYITTKTAISVPTSPDQQKRISKGGGDFTLTHYSPVPGWPHVTMYSVPDGRPFAGVYFGNQAEAAEESKFNLRDYNTSAGDNSSLSSASGPNKALFEYLGDPVLPSANMDERYTATVLTGTVLLAAQNAGITVKNVAVDDSEFPFLVGVICAGSDFGKLKAALKIMPGYEYGGGVGDDSRADGSDTCNVFNIVPYHAFPPGAADRIYHRLMLREAVFYNQISSQQQDLVPTHAQSNLPTMTLYLGDQTLDAELALTEKEQITGMMFRTNIKDTDSMLFVLSSPQRASFWMKNCPESLSAAYIGPDGAIEEIHHLEKNDTTPVNSSNNNIQFVLETKDGWFGRHNVGAGTVISTAKGTLAQTFLPNP